jgi:signal transduction histidine kinase
MDAPPPWLDRLRDFTHSIRFRLTLGFVVILGVVLAIFGAFVYTRQSQELHASALRSLELKASRLGNLERYSEDESSNDLPRQIPTDPESGAAFIREEDVVAILNSSAQVLRTWGPLNDLQVTALINLASRQGTALQSENRAYFFADLPGSLTRDDYAFLVMPLASEERATGYILLGSPVDPDGTLPRLLLSLLLGGALTLALALAGGFWLAGRAMQPVKAITRMARQIGETDLSRRLHLNQRDEIGELADTFDGMLARLEAAFDRQRQFTADASHELRTPLTIIELEADRALEAPRPPAEYVHSLKTIQSENQFMTRLVGSLLTLARMDSGQVRLDRETLDLSDLVLEVIERMAPLAKQRNVLLQAGELPELAILGDRQYLLQMLINLVDNAIKHSGPEVPRVQVEAGECMIDDQPFAWASVRDNGPGIPPEHLPRLFERFYQVDAARTQANEAAGVGTNAVGARSSGAGLGLSIARWIARAHGGEIDVESTPGAGTVFTSRLPLHTPGTLTT